MWGRKREEKCAPSQGNISTVITFSWARRQLEWRDWEMEGREKWTHTHRDKHKRKHIHTHKQTHTSRHPATRTETKHKWTNTHTHTQTQTGAHTHTLGSVATSCWQNRVCVCLPNSFWQMFRALQALRSKYRCVGSLQTCQIIFPCKSYCGALNVVISKSNSIFITYYDYGMQIWNNGHFNVKVHSRFELAALHCPEKSLSSSEDKYTPKTPTHHNRERELARERERERGRARERLRERERKREAIQIKLAAVNDTRLPS
jgi:hypothetical protein